MNSAATVANVGTAAMTRTHRARAGPRGRCRFRSAITAPTGAARYSPLRDRTPAITPPRRTTVSNTFFFFFSVARLQLVCFEHQRRRRLAPRPRADRIAERWRSERWDSLVANGPAWHDRFPGLEFSDLGPDDFASRDRVAEYFVAYAQKIAAPIRCGVKVPSVGGTGRPGFRAETSAG